jgi:class 3 adenylate cyclase
MNARDSSYAQPRRYGTDIVEATPWLEIQALMPPSLADRVRHEAINIAGERREVTVLFLDIANFTSTTSSPGTG